MSDLFLDIFNRSISAGWVVLAVILARFLLKKAPKSLTWTLWAIVGLRLLGFCSVPAPYSLIPSAEIITPESLFDRDPVITSGVPIIDNAINPVYTESFHANEFASVNPLQVWTAVAANIWLLVMIGIWAFALISWLRLRRRVSASVCLRENLYICDAIDTPFILGVFVPKIYLPSSLSEQQQRHVIAHEQAHIKRRDHWYKPFAYFLLSVNWFNPLIWVAYILLCRDIELACDEWVIEDMRLDEKKGYSTALLECSVHRHMIAACPLAFGEVGVKERVRAVLNYKKPAFWLVLIALAVIITLAVCFVTDPVDRTPEIRWGGALYVQDGEPVDQIPDKLQSSGSLRSTLHDSTPHPTEDGQSVGLDWEYAGQPLYLVGNALYLEEPGGGAWLPFRMKTPNDLLSDLLRDATSSRITVRSGDAVVSEELLGDRGVAMSLMLDTLRQLDYAPITESSGHVLSLGFTRSGDDSPAMVLYRDESANWTLAIQDTEYGQTLWQFECEELEGAVTPYLSRAQKDDVSYREPVEIDYKTFTAEGIYLRVGIPGGWEAEELGGDGYYGFRYRDQQMQNGWITVKYWPNRVTLIDWAGTVEPRTFRSGATANVYYRSEEDARNGLWEMMWFYDDDACMSVELPENYLWDWEYHALTMRVIGSVTVADNGRSMFTGPNLGIHLSVENPTPNGLMLITTQDGTLWSNIYTGADFSLAKWNGTEWEFLEQREDTAWTMVAYGVPLNETTRTGINWQWVYGTLEPGSYRIYKHYSAERGFLTNRETAEASCYAEFIIE